MPKGQRQEFRFVCREYRGQEVLCARNEKGGNTLLGLRAAAIEAFRHLVLATICNGDRAFKQLRCNPFFGETT